MIQTRKPKRRTTLGNQTKKTFALFTIIAAFYLTLFDWDLPDTSQLRLYWPYFMGIGVAIAWNVADRFLKHAGTPNFQAKELLLPHLLMFAVLVPAAVFINLPALGPPKGDWKTDYKLAFLVSYFAVTAGPKVAINYERFLSLISQPKTKENK